MITTTITYSSETLIKDQYSSNELPERGERRVNGESLYDKFGICIRGEGIKLGMIEIKCRTKMVWSQKIS